MALHRICKATSDDETLLAYHEAGHVVMGYMLGFALHSQGVDINQVDGGGTTYFCDAYTPIVIHTIVGDKEKFVLERMMIREVCVSLAGQLAEDLYNKKKKRFDFGSQDGIDVVAAVAKTLSCSEEFAKWFCVLSVPEARNYLKKEWNTVDLIAQKLLKKKRLTGKQLGALLAKTETKVLE